jgi:1,4-dihydroxy-2-naphthoate octaprenyltransferase
MSSLFLGFCVAFKNGSFDVGWALLAIVGIFSIEVAKNASGEIFDYDSGTDLRVEEKDRSPFSGGKRVLVDGILTRQQTILISATFYSLGMTVGLLLALARSIDILYLGIVGILCAYFYHGKPVQLSYRGFGELVVALCYGPLIAIGANLAAGAGHDWEPLLPSLPLALLVAGFLWINEFPDHDADKECGKMTLVVRLGKRRASYALAVIVFGAFGILLILPSVGYGYGVLAGLVGFPPAALACKTAIQHNNTTQKLVPAQGLVLLSFVLYALATGVGMVLAVNH